MQSLVKPVPYYPNSSLLRYFVCQNILNSHNKYLLSTQ